MPRSPEFRARMSETSRALWANPAYREKTVSAMRGAGKRGKARGPQSPESCARMSTIWRGMWQDPVYREKVLAAQRAAAATPHGRARLARAAAMMRQARRLKIAAADRPHYRKLRRILGVPAARAAMGL
jgi:hypothetical protein